MQLRPGSASVTEDKAHLRRKMRSLRLIADQKQGPDAAVALMRHVLTRLDDLGIGRGSVVAGYWPIDTEIDVRPLLARLHERDVGCALPVVVGRDAPLLFRRWCPEDELEAGAHGTWHPRPSRETLRPRILFVPLLAFDRTGYRLGHGGGYYDRTLAALRAEGPTTAIGAAYAIQRADHVPRGPRDQPLDWVVTEESLTRFPS